jgi:hypothetical protein
MHESRLVSFFKWLMVGPGMLLIGKLFARFSGKESDDAFLTRYQMWRWAVIAIWITGLLVILFSGGSA